MENKGIRKRNKQWKRITYTENKKGYGDYRRGWRDSLINRHTFATTCDI